MSGFSIMTKETKYTPGPWHTIDRVDGRHHTVAIMANWSSEEGMPHPLIAQTLHGLGHVDKETALANARLIASAPNLLEALKSLFEHCAMVHKHWGEGSNQKEANAAIADAKAAIAKATGETL